MAKNTKTVQHYRSNQTLDGKAKAPNAEDLLFGEIAINFAKDYETIFLKNSSGDVISLGNEVLIGPTEEQPASGTNVEIFIDTSEEPIVAEIYTKDQVYNKQEVDSALTEIKNEVTEIATVASDEVLIGNSAPTGENTTEIFIDLSEETQGFNVYTTDQTYSKEEVDSALTDIKEEVTQIASVASDEVHIGTDTPQSDSSTEIFIDLSEESASVEVYTKEQVDNLDNALKNQVTLKQSNLIESQGNLQIDESESPEFEVYTKAQVDALIANLQAQIDELKGA